MSAPQTYTPTMATTAHTPTSAPTEARYRTRTWLRGHVPTWLGWLFPKGRQDCGAHEWYRATDTIDRCYHCVPGERPAQPLPGEGNASQIAALEAAAAAGVSAADRALEQLRP